MVKQGKPLRGPLQIGRFWGRTTWQAGAKPPFESMWQAARPRVWGLTARLSGSTDAADDLTQEVAIQALRGYDSFRGDSDTQTWPLYTR